MPRDPAAAPTELEIKLRLPPGAEVVAALERHPLLQPPAGEVPETRQEATTYFDTPDRDLARAGASLRIRRGDDGRRVQTLKLRGGEGGPFGRDEWEWPVAGDAPDLGLLAATPAAALLREGRGDHLAPVFAAEVTRQRRLLRPDGAVVEAALDRGTVRAGEAVEEIRELELELKAGEAGPLYRLAAALHADAGLILGVESKAERGWRLRTGRPRAPRKGRAAEVPEGASGTEALRRILGAALADLLTSLPAASAGEMEGVHRMRIAVRRLRAALALFRPLLEPRAARRFDAELRQLGRVLGEARDWDVFCEQTLREVAAAERMEAAAPIELLRGPAEAERAIAHRRLVAELEGPALTATVLGLAAWAESPALLSGRPGGGRLHAPVARLAPALEARLARKVRRRGRRIRRREGEELHALRKALKRLRYGVEFLAPLHRRKRVKAWRRGCRALQESLGTLHDAAMAVTLAERLGGARRAELAPAVAALAGWAEARRRRARRHLRRDWRAFKAVPLPG